MIILHGISTVSLQSTRALVDATRELGHTADSVVYRSNRLLRGAEDRSLGIDMKKPWMIPVYIIRILSFFFLSLRRYDVFHFHFGHSLLPRNMDLGILKLFGKKVFMEYHGSEIRYIFYRPDGGRMVRTEDAGLRESSRKLQRRVEKHADGIIVHDEELQSNLFSSYDKPVHIVPLRVDLDRFPETTGFNPVPLVLHAPSHRGIKGTEDVIKAVEQLRQRETFNFRLLEGMDHQELLRTLRESDIVVDQLLIGSYGMLAVEAMALGKQVVCFVEPLEKMRGDGKLPVLDANPLTIRDVLGKALSDRESGQSMGNAARSHVLAHHDNRKVAAQLIGIYTSTSRRPPEEKGGEQA